MQGQGEISTGGTEVALSGFGMPPSLAGLAMRSGPCRSEFGIELRSRVCVRYLGAGLDYRTDPEMHRSSREKHGEGWDGKAGMELSALIPAWPRIMTPPPCR